MMTNTCNNMQQNMPFSSDIIIFIITISIINITSVKQINCYHIKQKY